jgi:Big-like domain-containing protein
MRHSNSTKCMALGLLGLAVAWGCATEPTALPIAVTVSPPTVSVATGGSQDFSVTVTNDPAAQGVRWSITGCTGGAAACGTLANVTNAVATYTAPAIVPPSTVGVTATSVADNSKSFTSVVTINPAAGQVASLIVAPESAKVVLGGTVGLSTQVRDQLGNTLSNQALAWSSDNATVATVRVSYGRRCFYYARGGCRVVLVPTGSAVITGVSEGTARVVVSLQGKSDTSFIRVLPDTIVGFAVSPSVDTLLIRGTVQLAGISSYKVGGQKPVPADQVTWNSLDPAVASVNGAGLVTAQAPGQTPITGTWNGFSATSQVTVFSTGLAFVVQPSSGTAGATMTPAVQVAAQDAQGQTDTSFTGAVSLAVTDSSGRPTAFDTLLGTTTQTAVSGVATFSDLTLNQACLGCRLLATAGGVASAISAPFWLGAISTTHLVFTVQPSTTAAGAPIATVFVTAVDDSGHTATSFTDPITIAIGVNPANGTLSGTTTVSALAGVATFADLHINAPGTGYTLRATTSGGLVATSMPFDITP